MQLNDGSTEERDKADQLLGRFYKAPFALKLSFLCDIYRVYYAVARILQVRCQLLVSIYNLVNVHQVVNVLPHVRYQQFSEVLSKYSWMVETVAIPDS